MSPLLHCLKNGHDDIASVILTHPKVENRINLENADGAGRTLLHLVAEQGNLLWWRLLTKLHSCKLGLRNDEGNTPLMVAALHRQTEILSDWLEKSSVTNILLLAAQNSQGLNLFMLVLTHLEDSFIERFIDKVDLSSCIEQKDKEGNNALLHAATLGKWEILKKILTNPNLDDYAFDIHARNKNEYTALVILLAAKVNVTRQQRNYEMKHDKENVKKMSAEGEYLWELVKLFLDKERDLQGNSAGAGKEAGLESLRKQMEWHRQLKPPLTEQVLEEFSNLYRVAIKAKVKKKPEPPPDIPKEEPKKVLGVSKFQQQMNDIYKKSEKDKIDKTTIQNGVIATTKKQTPPKIEDKNVVHNSNNANQSNTKPPSMFIDQNSEKEPASNITTEKAKPPEEITDDGPSVAEIRARWKKQRPELPKKKADDFNVNNVLEDLMKKAEEKVQKKTASSEDYISESMNEEIQWALEQKKQSQEESRKQNNEKESEQNKEKETKSEQIKGAPESNIIETRLEKSKIVKNGVENGDKSNENIKSSIEKFMTEDDIQSKEDRILQEAMDEEIQWAYQQKRQLDEENNKNNNKTDIDKATKPLKEITTNKINAEIEKIGVNENAAREKFKNEKQMIEQLEKLAAEKLKEEKMKKEEEGRQKEEEELHRRLEEEMRWANELKLQEEKDRAEKEKIELELKKKEDEKRLQEAVKENLRKEKEIIEKLEKQAKEKLEMERQKTKEQTQKENDALEKMPRWKKEKILRDRRRSSLKNEDVLASKEDVKKEPAEIEHKTQKFSAWLEKELDEIQPDESANPDNKNEIHSDLKPPAPVRRKKTSNIEDAVTPPPATPVLRPHRRSRVGDKSPSVAPESPAVTELRPGGAARSVGCGGPDRADKATQTDPVVMQDMAV